MKIKWITLILNLAVPLIVGGISGFLTRNAMEDYSQLNQPPLSPPSAVFPIVWTALFLLMGVSAYIVTMKRSSGTKNFDLPKIYWFQLAVNFIWPLIFFNLSIHSLAFIWLLILIVLLIRMITEFSGISSAAGRLQIPYLIWLVFAGYLNAGVWFLN